MIYLLMVFLICIDTTGEDTEYDLTLENFGTDERFQLWYLTYDEIEDYYS